MATDTYYKNLEKSRYYFNSIMDPVFENLGIADKGFSFRVKGKVCLSALTKDSLKAIEIEEENNNRDSIANLGRDHSLIRKILQGASYYAVSITDATVEKVIQAEESPVDEQLIYEAIGQYIAECSEEDEKVFCASNYNTDDYDMGDSSSPVSVIKGEKTVKSSTLLAEEIPNGTEVELEISYGPIDVEDDISDLSRFLLRFVRILDEEYILDEIPTYEDVKEIIKNNNEVISALLQDNDRVVGQLGKTIGLYERKSAFHIDKDCRIVIPENSFPKTIRFDEDMELIEGFFSNPKDEAERALYEYRLDIIKSSLRMIDLYKFVLSYMEVPGEIRSQTARACYLEWMEIVESILLEQVKKVRAICVQKTDEGFDGDTMCRVCTLDCNCDAYNLERKKCRYRILAKTDGKVRGLLEKFQNPDAIILHKGDEIEAEYVVDDALSTQTGTKILDMDDHVYEKLTVAFGVRNALVHKDTMKMASGCMEEIQRLEEDPYKTLDELEFHCKLVLKELDSKLNGAIKQGKCLREFLEHTDL